MTPIFLTLSVLLTLAALAVLLLPLLRTAPESEGRSIKQIKHELAIIKARHDAGRMDAAEYSRERQSLSEELLQLMEAEPKSKDGPNLMVVGLIIVLPLAVVLTYLYIGEPRALDPLNVATLPGPQSAPGSAAQAPEMEGAINALAERLRNEPDNLEGWVLLARAYYSTERFAQARDAFAEALRLAPQEPDLIIEFAETIALASPSRSLAGQAQELIERALQIDPQNQRGLWMMGMAAQQQQDFAGAERWWSQLLALLPADAPIRETVTRQIDQARQQAAGTGVNSNEAATAMTAPQTSASPTQSAPASDSAASLTVNVELAPELANRVPPGAVLFVFARAAEGPRMPLAIQRLAASSLPISVTLDDSQSMVEGLKLSTMPQVVVGARISISGDATPRSGDLEALSPPVSNTQATPVTLRIDRVID